MDNRELLELAAKAAGIQLRFIGNDTPFSDGPKRVGEWNPLENDGDALRLAVKLKFDLEWDFNEISVNYAAAEFENDDPYAATRRAIVRAAAEIGRSIP